MAPPWRLASEGVSINTYIGFVSDVVFSRWVGWLPRVIRDDGGLRLELGAGADALHQPRTFSFPITEEHSRVIQDDLARHLLLWVAILPLCDAAGTQRPLDEEAAVALLDPILLGTPDEVDALFREIPAQTSMLVGHGADVPLLERGQLVDSLHSATAESDLHKLRTYTANRERARRGVRLGPLDEAVLKYVGHYLHGSTRPGRHPGAVDPELLPRVMAVIATAEQARGETTLTRDGGAERAVERKHAWRRLEKGVKQAVRRAHPGLVDDAVRSVSFLMCSEAADRTREITDLSEAIVVFLKRYPGKNEGEFTSRVASQGLRDAVQSILDETMKTQVDWGDKTLVEIGDEVRGVMRRLHPDLSDAAVHKLGSYFTYLVK